MAQHHRTGSSGFVITQFQLTHDSSGSKIQRHELHAARLEPVRLRLSFCGARIVGLTNAGSATFLTVTCAEFVPSASASTSD